MDDIRFSELLFLQTLANKKLDGFTNHHGSIQPNAFKISPEFYVGMVATLLEELYVRFSSNAYQQLVLRLRGEQSNSRPTDIKAYQWDNPRAAIEEILEG